MPVAVKHAHPFLGEVAAGWARRERPNERKAAPVAAAAEQPQPTPPRAPAEHARRSTACLPRRWRRFLPAPCRTSGSNRQFLRPSSFLLRSPICLGRIGTRPRPILRTALRSARRPAFL